jgi:glycosyltransferase involved in cell wall biosynthesis
MRTLSSTLQLLATAPSPAGAAALRSGQTWTDVVVATPDTLDASRGPIVIVRGDEPLSPVAFEQAWWTLASDPSVPCVIGIDAAMRIRPDRLLVLRPEAIAIVRELAAAGGAVGPALAQAVVSRGLAPALLRVPLDVDPDNGPDAPFVLPRGRREYLSDPMRPLQRMEAGFALDRQIVSADAAASAPVGAGRRVLALFQGFPMGGYTAFNADLLPALAARGHRLTVAMTEWYCTDWRLAAVRRTVPDVHHIASTVPAARTLDYVAWLIETRRIESVFVSHSHFGSHLLPWLRGRFPRIGVVDFTHTDWFEQHMYGSYARLAQQTAADTDRLLVTSHALAREHVAAGVPAEKVIACHLGIDAGWWQRAGNQNPQVRQQLTGGIDRPVILYAGRVSPEKRPMLAFEIATSLWQQGHDFSFVVAGNGPLLQSLADRVAQSPYADRVTLLGELDAEILRAVYASADVYFLPSEIEGVARTLYEAMSMGCVPVVAAVGGQAELAVPAAGFAIPRGPDEVRQYTDALEALLTDPSRRVNCAHAARAHVVQHFTFDRAVRIVESALDAAAAHRAGTVDASHLTQSAARAESQVVLALEATRQLVVHHALRAQLAAAQAR